MQDFQLYSNKNLSLVIENLREATKIFYNNPAFDSAVRQLKIINSNNEIFRITQQFKKIFSGNDKIFKYTYDTLSLRNELLFNTQDFYLTNSLINLRNSLSHNNYMYAIDELTKTLSYNVIEAQSVALLKISKNLNELIQPSLPKKLNSIIRDLHIRTAEDLSKSKSVNLLVDDSKFFIESNPEDKCSPKEVNVLYSGIRLFKDLTEEEMFGFLNFLGTNLLLGSTHPVGIKILNITKSISDVINFDNDFFYHGRALDDQACPYTDQELLRAPYGVPSFGRFNPVGQNYYYFSNQEIGAINEVRKHSRNSKVQVAKLKPIGNIKLVDISSENENVFLKYCRYPLKDFQYQVPRQYLIPSFFSDCCKMSGFDGIKFYGSKVYQNYVTWKDETFKIVGHRIVEKESE